MAGDTVLTVIGNLTDAPVLRYTTQGVPVASFTVASTPRTFDRGTAEWKDGQALFLRCNLWRDAAENLAHSDLPRGARVIVSGRLKQRTFQTREGENRHVVELEVDEMGPSNRFATTKVTRVPRNGTTSTPNRVPVTDDPWKVDATPEPALAAAGAGSDGFADEPNF
ncbi:single-strand DNA-binding protein [Nocardia transvalensis]|uniref:Single-stranded DNA-binding protein n=1 Tax=Nocardia transvalensis TaxID=37333 RepID=A0A7W9PIN5_9NOCA|nr:single-stranded DNA-binding protein [Nocardia transvalensis]MBB5916782.1 single-strand DNA-binding protein [Nocardia transvalensis]